MNPRIPTRVAALALAALSLFVVPGCSSVSVAQSSDTVTIGVFRVAAVAAFDPIIDGFREEFLSRTGLPADRVRFVEENAQGDPALVQTIARTFAASDADMIAVIGTPAILAQAEQVTDRPLVAIAMGDPVGAGVARSLDAPGGNVTGSTDYIDPGEILDQIRRVQPGLRRVGTVHDPANQNSQVWVRDLAAAATRRGMTLAQPTVTGPTDVDPATRSLAGQVDAIVLGPDATVISAFPAVDQVAARASIPTYTIAGPGGVTESLVAALGPDYRAVGRLAGEAAAQVHAGTPAGQVAFRRPPGVQWQIDRAAAQRFGLAIPAELVSAGPISG